MRSYKKYFFRCFNYILISALSIVASCQQIQKKRNDNAIDTIKRDIPANKLTPKFRLIKKNIENKIGINSLENGIEGMEIRIWFANSTLRENLVILKMNNNIWEGKIYSLLYNYDSTNSLVSIDKSVKDARPKYGWRSFMDSLFELKILSLPDMSALKGYEIGFDGKSVAVEIASVNSYRAYSYWEPNSYSEFWQARNMKMISQAIDDELGISFP